MPQHRLCSCLRTKEGKVDYKDLSEYDGSKQGCDQCGREFEEGEVITVYEQEDKIFCYSDVTAGCLIAYAAEKRETIMMMGTPMRFDGSSVSPPSDPTPNHRPGEPILISSKKARRFAGLRRLLHWG